MTDTNLVRSRLTTLEAAWVIARRDFVAVLFSRAFLFFLLGPLFPVIVGGLAGSIGGEVQRDAVSVEVGRARSPAANAAMLAAGERLLGQGRQLAWPPWPGRHVVRLQDMRGQVLDEVRLEVRGAGVKGGAPAATAPPRRP